MEETKVKGPLIIAMKGLPLTGKTTLAQEIAKLLKCPIISLHQICNLAATAHSKQGMSSYSQGEHQFGEHVWKYRGKHYGGLYDHPDKELNEEAKELNEEAKEFVDHCYEFLCGMARPHLGHKLKIVIDSPLTRRSHLDRLLRLSTSTGSPLVVIDCKTKDKFTIWRKQGGNDMCSELVELERAYKDYKMEDVSNLEVYTSTNVNHLSVCSVIDHLAAYEGKLLVRFDDWVRYGYETIKEAIRNDQERQVVKSSNMHIHKLVLSEADHTDLGEVVRCEACQEPVSGPIYRCDGVRRCGIAIHKLCAELPGKTELGPENYLPFLRALPHEYAFPEKHRCKAHQRDLCNCSACLFETSIKFALVPTVILHRCHEHTLTLKFYPSSFNYVFTCEACGHNGQHVLYNCSICTFKCHVHCALLPHRSKQVHHRHTLTITAPPPPDKDYDSDEICDACEDDRNPKYWTYSCPELEDCNGFTCHLNCMTFGR